MSLFRRAVCLLALTALWAAAPSARAFPDRPVRLIVPFAAGGSTDVSARFLADALGAVLGQSVVVENRTGANGVVGTDAVARASADGHVLLLASASSHGVNPAVKRQLPFDALNDFAPVAVVGTTPLVFVGNSNFSGKTLASFLQRLRSEPGRHAYASAGAGSITHLAAELFKLRAGLPDIVHAPYRGGGPAMQAVLTGEVAFTIESLASAAALIQAGRVMPLAMGSRKRVEAFPDVPTFGEAGFPGFELATWNIVLAPRNTPRAIIEQLADACRKVLATETLKTKLASVGTVAVTDSTPESAGTFLAAEIDKFRAVVRDAKITLLD